MERGRSRLPRPTPPRKVGRLPFLHPRWRTVERHLAAHAELYLSAVAVATALVLPLALELGTDVQELAGAALAACVAQGLAHWLLRRRAAAVRREVIGELRGLLRDRINNQLQVVLFSLAERGTAPGSVEDRRRLAQAMAAIAAVSRTLDELSADSLRRWKDHYGNTVSGAASGGGSAADSGRGEWAGGR
jgi:hypothetical protein